MLREFWFGDCLELMRNIPDGCIDMVVTDPPYRVISGGNKSNVSLSNSLGGNNGKIFQHNDIHFDEWMPIVYSKMKNQSHAYIMTNFKNLFEIHSSALKAGFHAHNLLVWKKQNKTANRWYMKNCEYTLFLRKGDAFSINNPSSFTVHEFDNPIGCKIHPTEKPVDLMTFYIENSSNPGEIVLDPFAGSGTTAIAAMNTGRGYICIEKDAEYAMKACERIANHVA